MYIFLGKSHYLSPAQLLKTSQKTTFFLVCPTGSDRNIQLFCVVEPVGVPPPRQDALQRMTLSGMPNEAQWTSALEVPMAERYGRPRSGFFG